MSTPLRLDPELRKHLLRWYAAVKRPLPWRTLRDPYPIWVSEVMSQQTRVETVIPYWERWMQRFPTVEALASSPLDDVLHLWAGLGYYSRARNLHRGACAIVEQLGGKVPETVEGLRTLPGVGEYTAAAIASIAYGAPVSVVDGNVERVVCRWLRLEHDARASTGRAAVRAAAQEALDPLQPGDFNQAMMELGATVCTPRNPRCVVCPVAPWCRGRAAGDAERFPVLRPKAPSQVSIWWGVVARAEDGRVLMGRRVEGGLLGGLWEPPLLTATCDVAAPDLRAAGIDGLPAGEGTAFTHVFSHRRWVVVPVFVNRAILPERLEGYTELGWFDRAGLDALARSRLANKLLASQGEGHQSLLHGRFEVPSRRPRKERP